MKIKILIILIILISLGTAGFFIYKNIAVPEAEEEEPLVAEEKIEEEEKEVLEAPEGVEKPIEEAEEIKEPEVPVKIYNQNISGEIKQDQIWSGTIHVTGDIEIEEGVTLTILPGTVVEVAAFSDDQHGGIDHPHDPNFPKDPDRVETQSTKISVWGTLNAIGTPDNRIIFTSKSETPTTYDWDGLHISHGRLEYAIVEYARYNNFQESSDVIVANNIIRNILECCICIGHSKPISPQILNNDIYNCGHEGIDNAGGSPLIKGNYFHRENPEIQPDPSIGGVGIVVYKNAYPIIEDNVLKKHSNAIIFIGASMHEEEQGKEVIVRNNTIENNDVGINIDPDYPFDAVIMEDNQLINNKEDEVHFEWFQTGNTLSITQLQTKPSNELEDNRIGIHFSDLWKLEPEVFPNEILDASHILNQGVKRARFAINNLDWPKVHWSKPENTIDPSHDEFITSLVDNGITITYILTFWDKEYVAQGGEVQHPRFKTEEDIQRYLDFVQFIVHHFKDRIQYYEIWNEPNIKNWDTGDYTIQSIEVENYINLVKQAVPVIREEYPEAKIVVGGTTSLIDTESQDYLFSILRSDIMPLVDAISWHPMYGSSPEYDWHRQYYYNYPSLVQEIKDTASIHGFTGEYVADEIHWCTPGTPEPPWPTYSETKSAKYYARSIVRHLGTDVTVSQFYPVISAQEHPMQIVHTIQNLATIMTGNKPIDLPIEIQSEATKIKSYSFSLSNDDKLIALWTDGVAVDEDSGAKANLTIQGITSEDVTGVDVLNGYQQPIITSSANENLLIQNLIVRDYPLILRIGLGG